MGGRLPFGACLTSWPYAEFVFGLAAGALLVRCCPWRPSATSDGLSRRLLSTRNTSLHSANPLHASTAVSQQARHAARRREITVIAAILARPHACLCPARHQPCRRGPVKDEWPDDARSDWTAAEAIPPWLWPRYSAGACKAPEAAPHRRAVVCIARAAKSNSIQPNAHRTWARPEGRYEVRLSSDGRVQERETHDKRCDLSGRVSHGSNSASRGLQLGLLSVTAGRCRS